MGVSMLRLVLDGLTVPVPTAAKGQGVFPDRPDLKVHSRRQVTEASRGFADHRELAKLNSKFDQFLGDLFRSETVYGHDEEVS